VVRRHIDKANETKTRALADLLGFGGRHPHRTWRASRLIENHGVLTGQRKPVPVLISNEIESETDS
jgi:hypothetical protein